MFALKVGGLIIFLMVMAVRAEMHIDHERQCFVQGQPLDGAPMWKFIVRMCLCTAAILAAFWYL